jgi:hypothetical protein
LRSVSPEDLHHVYRKQIEEVQCSRDMASQRIAFAKERAKLTGMTIGEVVLKQLSRGEAHMLIRLKVKRLLKYKILNMFSNFRRHVESVSRLRRLFARRTKEFNCRAAMSSLQIMSHARSYYVLLRWKLEQGFVFGCPRSIGWAKSREIVSKMFIEERNEKIRTNIFPEVDATEYPKRLPIKVYGIPGSDYKVLPHCVVAVMKARAIDKLLSGYKTFITMKMNHTRHKRRILAFVKLSETSWFDRLGVFCSMKLNFYRELGAVGRDIYEEVMNLSDIRMHWIRVASVSGLAAMNHRKQISGYMSQKKPICMLYDKGEKAVSIAALAMQAVEIQQQNSLYSVENRFIRRVSYGSDMQRLCRAYYKLELGVQIIHYNGYKRPYRAMWQSESRFSIRLKCDSTSDSVVHIPYDCQVYEVDDQEQEQIVDFSGGRVFSRVDAGGTQAFRLYDG